MYRIGILAPASPFRLKLKKILETRFLVEEHSVPSELIESVRKGQIDVILFKVNRFQSKHIKTLKSLRSQLPDHVVILMVASSVPGHLRTIFYNSQVESASLIDARYELGDMKHVIHYLVQGEGHPFRKYCRYTVLKSGEVFFKDGTGESIFMMNLSYGGAQIKLNRRKKVLGERVCLRIETPLRTYDLEGRVVWQKESHFLAGVEFLKKSRLKLV
ncbi:MAG: PilZ domain-containing protein [Bdellovibrio sp.]|nr:MAG: PilZ domain-containing protein [Bdellovibrio sp.]